MDCGTFLAAVLAGAGSDFALASSTMSFWSGMLDKAAAGVLKEPAHAFMWPAHAGLKHCAGDNRALSRLAFGIRPLLHHGWGAAPPLPHDMCLKRQSLPAVPGSSSMSLAT